jgi:NADPH:quinone reductase-like Zn-dependent oxidoreductase
VRVKATALNRADLYQRQGTYPKQAKGDDGLATIAGLEAAGEVVGVEGNIAGFAIGERVMALCMGSYAEFITIDHRLAVHVPDRLSWEEAAAVPVSYMTEHDALITNAGLKAGESVLVHAAASGVGVAAIQIAKLFGAKPVIGTGRVTAKFELLNRQGMDLGINYQNTGFADAVLAATNGLGVNIIIDHIGGPHLNENLRCLALRGRLISVGRLGGIIGELNLDLMALKRLHLIGVTFRTRSLKERIAIAQRFSADLLPALADGRLRPFINRVFPLDQALEAQTYMTTNAQTGKIILTV